MGYKIAKNKKQKVKPEIIDMIWSLSHKAMGEICDRMETNPQNLYYLLKNNAQSLQKQIWQAEIRRALAIPVDQDINIEI